MRTARRLPTLAAAFLAAACASDDAPLRRVAEPALDSATYRPEARPLGWTENGRLLFAHGEEAWDGDAGEHRCGGSGVYETDGVNPPVPIVTGRRWCESSGMDASLTLANGGRSLFAVPRHPDDGECSTVEALNLASGRWRRSARICDAYLDDAAVSPDGRWLVGRLGCHTVSGGGEPTHVEPRGCTAGNDDPLTLMRLDGSRRRRVGQSGDRDPVFSPDGRSLAVMVEDGWHIDLIDLQSGRRRRVTRGENPAWSPDGRRIAFISFPEDEDDHRVSVRVIGVDGSGERTRFVNADTTTFSNGWGLSHNGFPTARPLWSPDGRRIVFARFHVRGETLWSVNADGTGLRQLTRRIEQAK